MTWTKLGEEFGDEARDLTDAEYRTHVEALCWSNRRLLDLYVPKRDLRRFAETADPEGAAAGLVAKGWWQDATASWYIGLRFPEWQLESVVIDHRRSAAALRQRRHRMHEAGDHSICLRANCAVTRDVTRDPDRNGSVRSPKTEGQGQDRTSSGYSRRAGAGGGAGAGGLGGRATPPEDASHGQPEAPSPKTGDGSNTVVHDDQQIPVNGSAGASHQTVTRARGGRPPLPEPTKQMILSLSAQGVLNQAQIARQAGVARSTVHKVLHQVAS
jgi:hypothetical protein